MIERIIGEGSIIDTLVNMMFSPGAAGSVTIMVTVGKESLGESTARGIPSQSL